MTSHHPHVLIVGAGLAGSLLACYLAHAGWRVTVCERRPDPRVAGYTGGRSINLALSHRGRWGLAGVGLESAALADGVAMPGRMIHPAPDALGQPQPLVFQPYSANEGDANYSVSRGSLNLTMVSAAGALPGVTLRFNLACVEVDLAAPGCVFREASGRLVRIDADLVIGADGAYSAVRSALERTDRFEYSQSYLEHGYKELTIPSARDLGLDESTHAGFAMHPHALHIWPRGSAMMIALPNADKTFTCTLFWPFDGPLGLSNLGSPDEVLAFFHRHYPDAAALMPTLARDYLEHQTGSLVTIRCRPWSHQGRVVLVGDAAHAIVPFYGQGMNAAFEDCRILAGLLARVPLDVPAALREYEHARKVDADAIADMALDNFIEMRDKVGSAEFRHRKRVEQTLHRLRPDHVTPQYNLVCFSIAPYREARRRGRALDAIIDRIVRRLPASSAAAMSDAEFADAVARLADTLFDGPGGGEAGGITSAEVLDITPAVTERLAVWPGDTPMSREVLLDIANGANITLSTLRATVHLGAHADGPNHYAHPAPGVGERSLEYYIGPCHVVEVRARRGERVRSEDLLTPISVLRHARVLLRTGTYPHPESFNEDFAGLSVELIDELAAAGVVTLGIDTPSVDLFDSKDLPAHHAMLRHDMAILEGLALASVTPGEYELIALPLKLMGFDASPVRAVLRPLPRA